MGLTAYIFDKKRTMVQSVRQIVELIHSEADGELTAEVPAWYRPKAGEYIGFYCADGRFRLFEIRQTDDRETDGICEIGARDAAMQELGATMVENAEIKDKTARAAMVALLEGTGWEIGTESASGNVGAVEDVEWETIAEAMERIGDTAKVELIPYFVFAGGKITGKRIDIRSRDKAFCGRIISGKTAADIVISEDGVPMTRAYGLGGYEVGEDGERRRVTIKDAEWSKAKGDPADKPKGQAYIATEDAGELPRHDYKYEDLQETDPAQLLQATWESLQEKKKTKISGSALAAELSYLPGMSHMAVQVGDKVAIKTKSGRELLERIANIRRHYVRKDRTTLEFGEPENKKWISKKVAKAENEIAKTGRRLGGAIKQTQTEVEDLGAELYRAAESIVELENEVATQLNKVWIDLDAVNARIDLKAESSTVSSLGERVTGAEVAIDALNAEVLLRAYTKDVDDLETAVYLRISAIDDEIELKADKITLNGYVTASQLSTTNAKINNLMTGVTEASALKASLVAGTTVSGTYGRFEYLYHGEHQVVRRSLEVSTPSGSTTLYYLGYIA